MNPEGSNRSMSLTVSPEPRKAMVESVSLTAASAPPPFAVPSSFVMTDAVDADGRLEVGGLALGALAHRRVQYEQVPVGLDLLLDALDLFDEFLVQAVTARRVHDANVRVLRRFQPVTGDLHRVVLVGVAVEVHLSALGHLLGLVVCAGPVRVSLDNGRPEPFRREPPRHLRGRRRLPRPVQAGEHNRLLFQREFGRLADEVDQFFVDDSQDPVPRGRPRRRFLIQRACFDTVGEVLYEPDIHVGLQQRPLNLLDDVLDVFFREPGFPPEVVKRPPE